MAKVELLPVGPAHKDALLELALKEFEGTVIVSMEEETGDGEPHARRA